MAIQVQSAVLGACSAGFVLLVLRMLLLLSASRTSVLHHRSSSNANENCPAPSSSSSLASGPPQSLNSFEQVFAAPTRPNMPGHIFHFQGRNLTDEDDVPLRQGNLQEITKPHEMKKRFFFEHLKSFRSNPLFKDKTYGDPAHPEDWSIQTYSRPFKNKEREVACPDEESTTYNIKGVKAAQLAYDDPDMFPPNLTRAKKYFTKAINSNPNCLSAKLNMFIVQVGESIGDIGAPHSDEKQGRWQKLLSKMEAEEEAFNNSQSILKEARHSKLIGAKYYWVRAVLKELATNDTADALVTEAFRRDPALLEEHIHPVQRWWRTAVGRAVSDSDYFLRSGLALLMMYYEFAPMMGGLPPIGYADVQRFLREWRYQTLFGVSRFTMLALQRSYQSCFDLGILNTPSSSNANTYAQQSNADILNTWFNIRLEETASRLAGAKMKATYGFSAFYNDTRFLSPHTDRTRCEMTFSILVGAYPSEDYCTLYYLREPKRRIDAEWDGITETQDRGRELQYYILNKKATNLHRKLGMLSVIRGRAITHWSPPTQKHARCVTVLAHYVADDSSQYERNDASIGIGGGDESA